MAEGVLAPGARVLIRDAEWIVRRVDPTKTGGLSILVVGVSEIVRHNEARFLTEIEGKTITVLDPSDTELVSDPSPQFRNTRLYLESLLRQSPPTGCDLFIGHQGAVDDLPYQLEPALLALDQPRQRILMADAVGLGKTIEVGILLSELIIRGKGKRILVVTTKSMMTQFQKELWSRFTIPVVRLDSVGLERISGRIPSNANPFHYFDKVLISIDTLKTSEFRTQLERSYWDVIVIDEAHNVAFRGSSPSLRARLAELLSNRSDTLIMASATPHDGKPASFASLMNMLNPTAIANPDEYGPEDIKGLFMRRFKKHVQEQIAGSFLERQVSKHAVAASSKEEAIYSLLADMKFSSFDRTRRSGQLLFRTVLEKSLFSSPRACLVTVQQRLKKLEKESGSDVEGDRAALNSLAEALDQVGPSDFTKYQRLLDLLRKGGFLKWDPSKPNDRVVLFTERIETLKFLAESLVRDLKLKPDQVAVLSGSNMRDVEITEIVEKFGRDREPLRLLLASDVASEGLNLHHLSHKLIHFDIPWSLMVFQQRNGRIDRYGQERQPQIAYLYTEPKHTKIRGDLRILELLMDKDEQAAKNIGDPSAFLNVFDAREEEVLTGRAIEDQLSTTEFDRRMEQAAQNDILSVLFGDDPVPTGQTVRQRCRSLPRLFANDLDYFQEGFTALGSQLDLQADFNRDRQLVTLTLNDELRRTFRALPPDAIPETGRLTFTIDRQRVKQAIKDCREGERTWPEVHLLWDLHPVTEWLNFKLMVNFGRNQAPVLRMRGTFEPQECIFLMQGEIPNRKGQPVVHEWFGVAFAGQEKRGVLSLGDLLKRTQLATRTHPNPGAFEVPVSVQSLVSEAVIEGRRYMSEKRGAFQERMRPRLDEERASLSQLRDRQMSFLDEIFRDDLGLAPVQRSKKEERRRRIEASFHNWQKWVEETLTTEDHPFLRVAAVFVG